MNILRVWILVFLATLARTYANQNNGQTVQDYTNEKRKKHGCQPLVMDSILSNGCEKYAQHMAKTNNFSYSDPTNRNYSENYCRFSPTSKKPMQTCVQNWYNGKRFDILDPGAKEFTAMIWRSSRNMGYGDAMIGGSDAIMVVRYTPPGNIPGQFTDNVPQMKKEKDKEKDKKKKKKKHKHHSSAVRHEVTLNLTAFLIISNLFFYCYAT